MFAASWGSYIRSFHPGRRLKSLPSINCRSSFFQLHPCKPSIFRYGYPSLFFCQERDRWYPNNYLYCAFGCRAIWAYLTSLTSFPLYPLASSADDQASTTYIIWHLITPYRASFFFLSSPWAFGMTFESADRLVSALLIYFLAYYLLAYFRRILKENRSSSMPLDTSQ